MLASGLSERSTPLSKLTDLMMQKVDYSRGFCLVFSAFARCRLRNGNFWLVEVKAFHVLIMESRGGRVLFTLVKNSINCY